MFFKDALCEARPSVVKVNAAGAEPTRLVFELSWVCFYSFKYFVLFYWVKFVSGRGHNAMHWSERWQHFHHGTWEVADMGVFALCVKHAYLRILGDIKNENIFLGGLTRQKHAGPASSQWHQPVSFEEIMHTAHLQPIYWIIESESKTHCCTSLSDV